MYVIEVSPLTRGSYVESLSYYSQSDYPVGSLVVIPVRKKEVTGLVLSSKPVSATRATVRAATFTLRRLPEQKTKQALSPVTVGTAKELSKAMGATKSAILFSLLPKELLNGEVLSLPVSTSKVLLNDSQVSVMTGTRESRTSSYKSRIREAFAHRGTVLFVAPTTTAVLAIAEELSSGIVDRTIVFTTEMTKKSSKVAYERFNDLSTSKLIITTPSHSFLDRSDITDIIIDNSSSGSYQSKFRPYLNYKEALITYARLSGRRVLLGDLIHRTEDEYLRREGFYQTEGEELHRVAFPNQMTIVKQEDKPTADSPFVLLSDELMSALHSTIKNKRRAFIYSARRGLAPVVACGDCGYIFRCPDSGTPYSLFRTVKNGEEKRWFLSSVSGRRVRADDTCPGCGSWRLRERGVGIQHIYDELKKHFDEDRIFVFDHTTATTKRKAAAIMGDFYEKKGAILLGTEMSMSFLEKPVSLSAVVSLDAVRSVPTWRVDEECFSLLFKIREKTDDELIVQTRSEPDYLLDLVKVGQIDNFFTDEIALRQSLNYPPFTTLVHLTMTGAIDAVRSLEAEIAPRLEKFGFVFYSAPESIPNRTTRYGLCRTRSIEADLIQALRSLPPTVRVEINPRRIV